jgi:hypothetical protein
MNRLKIVNVSEQSSEERICIRTSVINSNVGKASYHKYMQYTDHILNMLARLIGCHVGSLP